jgi:hypothetical protein
MKSQIEIQEVLERLSSDRANCVLPYFGKHRIAQFGEKGGEDAGRDVCGYSRVNMQHCRMQSGVAYS